MTTNKYAGAAMSDGANSATGLPLLENGLDGSSPLDRRAQEMMKGSEGPSTHCANSIH